MSIFKEIKEMNFYNGESGKEELKHIYADNVMTVKEQLELGKDMVKQILDIYNLNESYHQLKLKKIKLIDIAAAFMMKINALVQEDVIKKSWIVNLTEELIYKGEEKEQVKLGLILAGKYLSEAKIAEVVDVFTHSGEYVFYLIGIIKNLQHFNSYLIKLSQKVTGTIKVFAITNIEVFDYTICHYMIEEGYKDDRYENLLINYILSTVNVKEYLSRVKDLEGKIDGLAYLVYKHLRTCEFRNSPIQDFMVEDFSNAAKTSGTNFYCLMSIFLINEGLKDEEKVGKEENKKGYAPIEDIKGEKWKHLFLEEIHGCIATPLDIIELANFYKYNLKTEDVAELVKRSPLDFYLYWYINTKENDEKKLLLLNHFFREIDIETLLYEDDNKRNEESKKGDLIDILFALVIRGCGKIQPRGKEIALKGLFAKADEARGEAIKALIAIKDILTDEDMEIIKKSEEKEINYELKIMINRVIFSDNNCKIEFVEKNELKKLRVSRHVKDIYLMGTYVSGFQFRDLHLLKRELKKSKIYFLKEEFYNPYDNRAIKIVGQSGYVIGYIPRKDNLILSNLISKGIYLYAVVREYSLDESHISIDVYFSYKNILDEAGELFRVLTAKESTVYEN